MTNNPIIRLEHVKVHFPETSGFRKRYLKAVDDVSFEIYAGETVGLVGESGCGKSTLGRAVTKLLPATDGHIYFHEKDIYKLQSAEKTAYRKNVQMIFQDPAASLNPRLTVKEIIAEPLLFHVKISKEEREDLIKRMIQVVGLPEDAINRYPHEFSGGQQQRIGIARSLVLHPEFIVCDEAVSALDVSVQAQVLNLLKQLKKDYNLTYLFISHNLSVVKHMCDRIIVMYLGKIVEMGSTAQIFENPLHPYTKALISAIPAASVKHKSNRIVLSGDLPSPSETPSGCAFHNRCFACEMDCDKKAPQLFEVENGHWVSCIKCR